MSVSFKKVSDGIISRLNAMASNAKDPTAFLNRQIYSMYQKAQIARWDSENVSQGARWKRLTKEYESRKLKKFSAYPYNGTRLLIATGTLFKNVVGQDTTYHRKLVTTRGITIQTTLSYAPFVADERPFMNFNQVTIDAWKQAVQDYIMGRST